MQKNWSISVENSINSGQVFLWKKKNHYWYGINGQDILRVDNLGNIKTYQDVKTDFFRKKDDIGKIIKSISRDSTTKEAVQKYPGLRLLDQDPFQCLISFIVSSNSNIQKIKNSLERMSQKFGTKAKFEDQEFFLFPKPEKLAKASINEITNCGVGYRAKFIKEAANMSFLKKIDFEYLGKCNYHDAKENICSVPGVGNKVADCILLFSLNKLDAFPLDRWMIRILEKYYLEQFQITTKTITDKQYDILHEKIVNHYGQYAGYAQQFLFKMERENYKKKWL
jgi:N-glycosylase/DNA lyase